MRMIIDRTLQREFVGLNSALPGALPYQLGMEWTLSKMGLKWMNRVVKLQLSSKF